jgi:hypothetical protein
VLTMSNEDKRGFFLLLESIEFEVHNWGKNLGFLWPYFVDCQHVKFKPCHGTCCWVTLVLGTHSWTKAGTLFSIKQRPLNLV